MRVGLRKTARFQGRVAGDPGASSKGRFADDTEVMNLNRYLSSGPGTTNLDSKQKSFRPAPRRDR
jgi:hypothetical protein